MAILSRERGVKSSWALLNCINNLQPWEVGLVWQRTTQLVVYLKYLGLSMDRNKIVIFMGPLCISCSQCMVSKQDLKIYTFYAQEHKICIHDKLKACFHYIYSASLKKKPWCMLKDSKLFASLWVPRTHGPWYDPYRFQSTGNGSHHWIFYSLEILRCVPRTQVVSSWWVPFEF